MTRLVKFTTPGGYPAWVNPDGVQDVMERWEADDEGEPVLSGSIVHFQCRNGLAVMEPAGLVVRRLRDNCECLQRSRIGRYSLVDEPNVFLCGRRADDDSLDGLCGEHERWQQYPVVQP